MRYILIIAALFCSLPQIFAQNNITYGAGISYTNGAPSFVPPARTSRVAIDTITGKWYHFNTPGGWQLLGNTIEEIAGCSAPAYTPTKGDSKVVINNCTEPELYYWTGSAWVWINEGATYYAGEGIRIQNDSIILDSLYTLRFRTGSTTDGEAGRLTWDANEGTIDVVLNAGNVTGQMFEDVFFNCRNQTGTPITRGTVVMAVGTQGASGRILIAPAIANGTVNSEYILGTAAMDIANGSDGLVYHFGKDRGLNTTGASCGETWADRDILYCSATTAGCLTKTIPTAPNLKVPIAFVIRAGNNGTLFVRPSHFPDLNQINDVQLTSPTTGQTLIYNSVTDVWSNQTPADPSSTNELQTLSVAANTATLSNSGGSVTIAGAGINTVGTAGTTITVTGTEVDGSVSNELQTLSTGTNTLTLSNGGGTVTVDTDPASDVTGSGVANQISYWSGTQTQTGNNNLRWLNSVKTLRVNTPSDSLNYPLFVGNENSDNNSGSIFITNSFPGLIQECVRPSGGVVFNFSLGFLKNTTSNLRTKTHEIGIVGNARSAPTAPTVDYMFFGTHSGVAFDNTALRINSSRLVTVDNSLHIGTTSTSLAGRLHVVGSTSSSSTWTAQFHNSASNNNALMIRDDGNVGIGTSAVAARLNIAAAGTSASVNAINTTNGTPSNIFAVRENGDIYGLSGIFYQASDGRLITDRIRSINTSTGIIQITGGNTGTASVQIGSWTTITKTSGDYSLLTYNFGGFQPTSGNCRFSFQEFIGTINQTGGANGITRGMYLNPTLTNAADWRSIEWTNISGFGLYGSGTADNYLNGNLGIKTTSPTDLIDINGANGYSQLRLRTAYTPTGTADANGNTGDVSWDADYIYIKTAAGWKRSALSTF
jgi:hypothetical protein